MNYNNIIRELETKGYVEIDNFISNENILFLEDYSYLISAYLSLYQSTFNYDFIEKRSMNL